MPFCLICGACAWRGLARTRARERWRDVPQVGTGFSDEALAALTAYFKDKDLVRGERAILVHTGIAHAR